MESQGTYQAGNTTADESATPEKVVPLRPYTKKDNAYADRLIGVVSPSAYYLLDYLIRQTVGFHRDSVRYSSKQLATVTHLSQRTIFTAIRELETLRVLAKDAGDMGRTQIRTFRLLNSDVWQLPERDCQTTANFAVVEKRKRTTAKTTVDEPVTTANFAEDATQTTANFADLINNRDIKETPEERNDLLSDASDDAPRPILSSSSEKPSASQKPESKARKTFTPDSDPYRLAIHLRDGILSHKPDARVPHAENQLQQWAGVIDLMIRLDKRTPEQIRALIDAIMTQPRLSFWRGVILSPGNLRKHFDAIEIKWNERSGNSRASQNGHAPSTPPPASPGAEDALTRKGRETRERIQRERAEREAREATAKGAPL